MKIALYTYWRSSSAYRVRIALAAKGVDYQSIPVDLLAREHRSPEYLAANPTGYVPCLVVDGRPFIESSAIVELLEELYPTPRLLPEDREGRADVRALVQIVNAGTQPLQNLNVLQRVSDDPEARQLWSRHFIEKGLDAFDAAMGHHESAGVEGPFAYGGSLSLADVYLVPQAYNARRFGVDLERFPRIARALRAAEALPSVQAAHPDRQPDRPADPAP